MQAGRRGGLLHLACILLIWMMASTFALRSSLAQYRLHGGATLHRVARSRASSRLFAAASARATPPKPMPITVLSGFLGAGKTSFLSHLLNNKKGVRFGLVVNDMASVNVDAKQIRSQSLGSENGIETMELQNGCVCCNLAEDLIISIVKLIDICEMKGTTYDHIIVECSGIAEPRRIREMFQATNEMQIEFLKHVQLDTLITLVDAEAFLQLFGTDQNIAANRKLAYSTTDSFNGEDGNAQRSVTELLLEQVECADIVLVNKCDLLKDSSQVDLVTKVVKSVNPTAKVRSCVRGEVENPMSYVGSFGGKGMVAIGTLDEHRNLVNVAAKEQHDHSSHAATSCTHDHNHGHGHGHEHDHKHGAHCTSSHSHDHSHSHGHSHKEPAASHDHCHDPHCSDPSHDHGHDHGHDHTTAESRFGITSFVYRRRRPFHPVRFTRFLQSMGKLSVKGLQDVTSAEAGATSGLSAAAEKARKVLLRSKGFVWMGSSKLVAYFMSHAGQYLEMNILGRWWSDIPRSEWPTELEEEITMDFEGPYGDKRQEIVFIGMFAQKESREALEQALDACLLTDEELRKYEEISASKGDQGLREYFMGSSA